jgi:hypothetical protein
VRHCDLDGLLLRSTGFGWQQQQFDPYREKVAEEMLLCEIIVQHNICQQKRKNLLMRCCAAGLRELPSLRGSCRQTASIFKRYV